MSIETLNYLQHVHISIVKVYISWILGTMVLHCSCTFFYCSLLLTDASFICLTAPTHSFRNGNGRLAYQTIFHLDGGLQTVTRDQYAETVGAGFLKKCFEFFSLNFQYFFSNFFTKNLILFFKIFFSKFRLPQSLRIGLFQSCVD